MKRILLAALAAACLPAMTASAIEQYSFLWTAPDEGLIGEKLAPLQAPEKQIQAPAMIAKEVQAPVQAQIQAPAKFDELFAVRRERAHCVLFPGRAERLSRRADRAELRARSSKAVVVRQSVALKGTVLEEVQPEPGLLLESLAPTVPISSAAMVREPGVCGAGGCGSGGCGSGCSSGGGRRLFFRRR